MYDLHWMYILLVIIDTNKISKVVTRDQLWFLSDEISL